MNTPTKLRRQKQSTASNGTANITLPARDEMLRLYEQMVLLRRFELKVQELYKGGKLPGFVHLYLGEEAAAVGVCAHLKREDWITSTHRGEPLVEVETDKAINEIEAPASGILARIVTPVGTVVKMGGQLGIISPQA